MRLQGIGITKDSNGLLRSNDFFYLLIQSEMGVQKKERGRSYNEHSKYSMPTGYRFYPERAL